MFIDMHAHAFALDCPPRDGRNQFSTPEELLRIYDQNEIEMGILMPLIGPEVYLPQSNEEILAICAQYPDRFIPFCNLDPRGISNSPDSDFTPWLQWYIEHGVKGVGEFMPNLPFTHPLVLNFFRQLEQFKLPVTFDISGRIGGNYGLYDDPGLGQLEECLRRMPQLIIIGHGTAFWSEIGVLQPGDDRETYLKHPVSAAGAVVRLLRSCPNLWADLSAGSGYYALARDRQFAAAFLNEFQDRLMYGTDICDPKSMMPTNQFLLDLHRDGLLNDTALTKIASANARKLLKI